MLKFQGRILIVLMMLGGCFFRSDIQIRHVFSIANINYKYNFGVNDTISKRRNNDTASIRTKIQTELKSCPNPKEKIKPKIY
jgi:hypothetical protein